MVEKSQDKEMDKSVAVGNVENNSEKQFTNTRTILKVHLANTYHYKK